MEKDQAFRIADSESEIKYLAVDHVNGQDVIFWREIQEVFPRVKNIKRGRVVLSKLKDADGIWCEPLRIKYHPDEILFIVLSTDAEDMAAPSLAVPYDNIRPLWNPIDKLSESISNLAIAPQPPSASSPAKPRLMDQTRRNTVNIQHQIDSVAEAIELAHQSGQQLSRDQLTSLIHSKLSSTLQTRSGFEHTVIRELGSIHDQGATTQQIALKVLELQKQMNDRLILIQKKTEAILTQQVELAEYPIPRLFIVLPEKPTEYDPAKWFRTKFRLHFICDCGEHTQPAESKVVHHLHLAKHEGYLVREPTAFFKKYGPFLILMLELIKAGSNIAGHVVPALASLKMIELADSVLQTVETGTAMVDYSLECIDKEMEKLRSSSLGELSDTDRHPLTQHDLVNYLSNVEGLEGVELRLLGSFLKTSKADNILGNLYRMVTKDGHVKWVCRDHYRAGYQEAHTQRLRDIIRLANGTFDEQLGTVEISLQSSFAAAEFFGALVKAKGVLELIVDLNWECAKKDVDLLRDAIKKSMVAILHIDLRRYQPSLLRTQLSSTSARYEPLYRLIEPVNLRSVHLVLPQNIIKLSNFSPRKPAHLRRLTFELHVGVVGGYKQVKVLSEVLRVNFTTTVVSWYYSYGVKGAQALSEELKTNVMQPTLDLRDCLFGEKGMQVLLEALKTSFMLFNLDMSHNKLGDKGAQALFEGLKVNSVLTSLDMGRNLIEEKGAQALSETLKINSTLTTLEMGNNSIGDKGVQVLSEALISNSTLTALSLRNNSIGEIGAQALSEVLKNNSTLINLSMGNNSIGEKGAKALSKALEVNSTLTTLNLWKTSIGEKGAQVLAEALKTNSALTTLDLWCNSIGDKGAQDLSEVLKTNATLIILNIKDNSIGEEGAQALSEALKSNSTLTTLHMGYNLIKEKGAQALSKALEINSALTTLDLWNCSIGEKGAQALSEALKTNSTLTTLDLWKNSIGDKGAQALSEALKTNSTLTTLDIRDNSIGMTGLRALSKAQETNTTVTTLI